LQPCIYLSCAIDPLNSFVEAFKLVICEAQWFAGPRGWALVSCSCWEFR